jgi:rubrerythrin
MELKGSLTETNLAAAFAGESQAGNKYAYFASKAKDEGYEQIAGIFWETAENEKEHAKLWLKYLNGIGSTEQNLKAAADGEHYEWAQMYAEFARVAQEEGFIDIATTLQKVGEVEAAHEERYTKLLQNIEANETFRRNEPQRWHCRNCGYVHDGTEAPKVCPSCKHSQAYFELYGENF